MSLTSPSAPRSKCQTAEGPIPGRKLIIQDERKRTEDSVCQWSKKKNCKLEEEEWELEIFFSLPMIKKE